MSSDQNGYRLKCPSCGAIYWYSVDKFHEDGFVECQNCAMKIFTDSGLGGDIKVKENQSDVIVPSREPFFITGEGVKVKCPLCKAEYIYKETQRLEDGRVHCQNCGEIIDAVGQEVLIYDAPAEPGGFENTALVCIIVLIILFVPIIIAVPALICIAAIKICSSMSGKDDETKVYSRDTQGPGPR
jgi:predicted Zn finger-like uncharacterized protein